MTLDIIIPHYKEDTRTLMRTISMINNQLAIDKKNILITVVTDGYAQSITKKNIEALSDIKINFINTGYHAGPGYARQFAMDRTNNDYILFCDTDDILASPFVLKYFKDKLIENPDLDCIFTAYLEEVRTPEGIYFDKKDDDVSITCLHGKLYKRSFIYENDIRFPNWMISEDGTFNFKVVCHAKNMIFDDDVVTYIWKYSPQSLTRANTSFIDYSVNVRAFKESIKCFEEFFKETIFNPTSQVKPTIIKPFIDSLQKQLDMLNQIPNLNEYNLADIKATQLRLDECKQKFKEYYDKQQ